jgi:hypothetical protein
MDAAYTNIENAVGPFSAFQWKNPRSALGI